MILPRLLYDLLVKWADTTPVPRDLLAALVQAESGWNPDAIGDDGHSVGLGQLHDQGAGAGLTVDQRRDPDLNLQLTAKYLRSMLDHTPTVADALSAYNQGLGGWTQRGILNSQRHYIGAVIALQQRLAVEGISPDDGAPSPTVGRGQGEGVTITLSRAAAAELQAVLAAVL